MQNLRKADSRVRRDRDNPDCDGHGTVRFGGRDLYARYGAAALVPAVLLPHAR